MELFEAVYYFENLKNKKIIIDTDGDLKIELMFLKENFYHLIGMHKLGEELTYRDKKSFYKKLLDRKSDNLVNQQIAEKIMQCENYLEVKERLYFFNRIPWLYIKKELHDLTSVRVEDKGIKADYYLSFKIHQKIDGQRIPKYIYLFFSYDEYNKVYCPVSFFSRKKKKRGYSGEKIKRVDKISL